MMPVPLKYDITAYPPCPNCGDLMLPGSRFCPHCGAGREAGSPAAGIGMTILRILAALGLGLLLLPIGALGACTTLVGIIDLGRNFGTFLYGLGLLAVTVGGFILIVLILRGPRRGARR